MPQPHHFAQLSVAVIEEALRLGAADLFGRENTANDSGLVEPEKPYKANGSFPLIQSSLAYVIYS